MNAEQLTVTDSFVSFVRQWADDFNKLGDLGQGAEHGESFETAVRHYRAYMAEYAPIAARDGD